MRRHPSLSLLAVPLLAMGFAGCTADAPTDVPTRTFTKSMNEVRSDARAVSDALVAAFGEVKFDQPHNDDVEACADEDPGIARWNWIRVFGATDPASTIAEIRETYASDVTTSDTPGDVEVAPGRSVIATSPYTLIRNDTGSYLLQSQTGAEGIVTITVFSACGVLS
ncbi:lactoylglutathione lyase [Microbacterium testaceum StLB037]|uniref:Lactoylglutathione lyase n=1 Tax=Microbacterium testaceum (strain StLB037) TaxID=979556 RepID=E8N8H1_MICTS|nr:hypothetical protein [Microbacterium testaceum]BAJ74416.1 lactoylglutathione lyase [Microbacterium testaceum StLB037]